MKGHELQARASGGYVPFITKVENSEKILL